MSLNTVNAIFYRVVERQSGHAMLSKQAGKWTPISSSEFYRAVAGVARALQDEGIGKGDRVAILSENRVEWAVADFATLLLGGVVVPIYCTLTSEQTAQLLNDAGVSVIFVSTADQLKKFLSIKDKTQVRKAVIMDDVGGTDAASMHLLMSAGPHERDGKLNERAASIGPDDLATIIYTSGTTGTPKGAMLTHGNLASNVEYSLRSFPFTEEDVYVSFLPLAHVTARHVDYSCFYHGITIAYCSFLDQLPATLLEVRPTMFVAVPRVYEKIYAQVQQKTRSGLKRAIYNWGIKVGHAHRDQTLNDRRPSSLSWRLANILLYSQVRKGMGGRGRIFFSGGAPLGRDLGEWFADLGIRIDEGYGLTETSPIMALNNPQAHKLGTVGKPLENVEVKIAEDGEILVRGPSVFKGYWNLPEETRNAFVDGWFKTGDIGALDNEGFLRVTDRKKDLLKTSGGKFIAPQPIEKALILNPMVGAAVVLGDRRKFPSVVIVPQFSILEDWAGANGIAFSSREELVANPKVRALYEGIVADLNRRLARYEQLKKFLLLPNEFSIADGTLTPSMKQRRHRIEELYRRQIEEMYAEPAVAALEARS
ncbi:MAG TPA: long-chain fatty acid--CoA ligase [Terriglobales bacterium]|nr:long-chain fatty acid--CoA ligase [Terriglobales bacterium]